MAVEGSTRRVVEVGTSTGRRGMKETRQKGTFTIAKSNIIIIIIIIIIININIINIINIIIILIIFTLQL